MINAILVEDDRDFAVNCIKVMERCGLAVHYFADADSARTYLLTMPVDLAVIDLMLPPSFKNEGLGLLQSAKNRVPKLEAILITKKQDQMIEVVAAAMRLGAKYFLDKEVQGFLNRLEFHVKEILVEQANNVFISHGHNDILRFKLKDFVQNRYGRTPVILSEQPSKGLTIVEKLEKASKACNVAIILMTKDDLTQDGGVRARQNVIHEIGFFQGKYGRNNVILLAEKGLEVFSNISGIVRIDFDSSHFEAVFEPLRIELDALEISSAKIAETHITQLEQPEFLEYLDGLSGDELYRLAGAVLRDRQQSIGFYRNEPIASVLVKKGFLERVPIVHTLQEMSTNVGIPFLIRNPVWRYLNENKRWLLDRTIELNGDRQDRLTVLRALPME